jgi:hypothetical protein
MSWYDPSSWSVRDLGLLGGITGGILTGSPKLKDAYNSLTSSPGEAEEAKRKKLLVYQAGAASKFANQSQGGYNTLGGLGTDALARLQAQANGANSVSAEQLRQGIAQGIAAQRSMAAGAAPQNAAAAARTAAIQSARLSSGLAGQQALAGLQERNQAQQAYGSLLQGLRGQDLQAALGSRQNALTGYSANNTGQPEKSDLEKLAPIVQAGTSLIASDRRAKTDIKDGSKAAESALRGLGAYVFKYKDEAKHGKGVRPGIMTDDLKRAGLGHAVVKGADGTEMVHGGHLATSIAAMLPGIHKRVSKLEGKES